ncbi:MAG: AMP-dependent synthetase [Clostridiales bacterium]|nr:AMP-dependent synthetase [Clostridiales bacterium]
MKLAFSNDNVQASSFLELCNLTSEYGFAGFEIVDAKEEKKQHSDSIFHSSYQSSSRRKLVNRHINISVISFNEYIDENTNGEDIKQCVEMAVNAGVSAVTVKFSTIPTDEKLKEVFSLAIQSAEKYDISILLETEGPLSDTKKVLDVINLFGTACIGVSWNIRETYFNNNESADNTIQTLGAYIQYVRIGDKSGKTNVLIGEGDLPVKDFVNALKSLNYDGYVCALWNDEITDPDIVLTHFVSFMSNNEFGTTKQKEIYYNRSKTGTFPWPKYDVLDITFSEVLDEMVERYPDQLAFKYTTLDYTRTYSQFRDDVDKVAAALISLGVKPGHHVAIWATNVPEWFLTFWATVKIGAVLVTVNTAYKIHEAEYLLRQSDTHTLVMIDSCKDSDYKAIIEELCPELKDIQPGTPLYSKTLPFLRNVVTVGFNMDGCLEWDDFVKRSELVPNEEVRRRAKLVKSDDVCNMQYTSGTTGFPKGVMLTHNNIINNGKIIGDRMDISTADRMMIQVPMFHCFGMVLSMTNLMTHGGTICPMPYFSPKSSLACINNEKITCFNGVPTMFIAMFNHEDFAKTDFSYIRTGIMAGANCPPELMRKAADEMNMKEIISVYGQTEASPGCTMGEVNEDIDHRVETVGSAFPGVECKIIDPETGEELPDGENGEFVARGYNIMKGYYKMPKATEQTIDAEGWLHSGDICCRTPDGYFKVTGRLKDMIIRGGENLYPREIEEFYLTNDKVRDVQVVGVPDQRYGEEACAWIILKDGVESSEDEMREYGNSHMAKHKVPRYFIFTKEFPMNAAGKILKYKMRDESIKILGIKK